MAGAALWTKLASLRPCTEPRKPLGVAPTLCAAASSAMKPARAAWLHVATCASWAGMRCSGVGAWAMNPPRAAPLADPLLPPSVSPCIPATPCAAAMSNACSVDAGAVGNGQTWGRCVLCSMSGGTTTPSSLA